MNTKQHTLKPQLRFSEFEGEWRSVKIGDLTTVTAGGTPSTLKKEYWNGNIPWMNSGELNLKRVYDVQNRITELGLKKSSTKIIPINSILIGLAGQGKTRGTAAINLIELCINQSIAAIYPNTNLFYSEFLYQNIDNRYEELRNLSTGAGGRGGLNLSIIKSFQIPIPSLPEQQKIASFFSDVDLVITKLTKKKELLEQYKKGVMQKIFNQQLRFKDDEGNAFPIWEEKKLGKVSEINKGEQLNAEFLTKVGSYPCISGGINPSGYTEDFNRNENTITISEGGNSCGYVNLFKTKFWCGGHCYAIENLKNNVVNDFLFQILKQSEIKIMRLRVGSGLPNIQKKDINNFKFKLPVSIVEQTKIANFLSDIDIKIEALNAKIENSKSFKKGLLQQMFV